MLLYSILSTRQRPGKARQSKYYLYRRSETDATERTRKPEKATGRTDRETATEAGEEARAAPRAATRANKGCMHGQGSGFYKIKHNRKETTEQ